VNVNSGNPPGDLAARLRGFGPAGLAAFVVVLLGNGLFVPLSALLVLAWARLSSTPLHELGLARPIEPWRILGRGVAMGVIAKLVFKSVLMPLLGAPPVNAAYAYLTGNAAALPGMVLLVLVGAGFGEEVVFRGYLFERLRKLLGRWRRRDLLVVALSSLVFGAVHLPEQGLHGAEQAALLGMLLGGIYLREKTLWMPMVVHAAFDLTAVGLIFTASEQAVATLFFHG